MKSLQFSPIRGTEVNERIAFYGTLFASGRGWTVWESCLHSLRCTGKLRVARRAHLRGFAATVGNLRLDHERRLVAQNSVSWNRLEAWLRNVSGLQQPA